MNKNEFSLPGDDSLPGSYWIADQEVFIRTKPEKIWPWLAQMGGGRAGWYSYDWIDNFGKKSFTSIDPNLQSLEKDQKISVFKVEDFKESEYLILKFSKNANMTWFLKEEAEGTRLITRVRVNGPKWLLSLTLGPGHYIMQRKQFIELKKRAES